jgi:hypothetical protein
MNDWFEEKLPTELSKKLPVELWLHVKKFYIIATLKDKLKFPVVTAIRKNHELYADFYQATIGVHRWDIEIGGPSLTSLLSYYYKEKRYSFDWTGITMVSRERVFGVGFNIDETFLNMIFMDDDYWNFESVYDNEDSLLIQLVLSMDEE